MFFSRNASTTPPSASRTDCWFSIPRGLVTLGPRTDAAMSTEHMPPAIRNSETPCSQHTSHHSSIHMICCSRSSPAKCVMKLKGKTIILSFFSLKNVSASGFFEDVPPAPAPPAEPDVCPPSFSLLVPSAVGPSSTESSSSGTSSGTYDRGCSACLMASRVSGVVFLVEKLHDTASIGNSCRPSGTANASSGASRPSGYPSGRTTTAKSGVISHDFRTLRTASHSLDRSAFSTNGMKHSASTCDAKKVSTASKLCPRKSPPYLLVWSSMHLTSWFSVLGRKMSGMGKELPSASCGGSEGDSFSSHLSSGISVADQ
mmetsp:Transcript_13619/g.33509  ORF Transcript_13619/g.33509 Transcript_13619/m.33509 type:complete len:315 (+) Transcript_13619:232-1176(+)